MISGDIPLGIPTISVQDLSQLDVIWYIICLNETEICTDIGLFIVFQTPILMLSVWLVITAHYSEQSLQLPGLENRSGKLVQGISVQTKRKNLCLYKIQTPFAEDNFETCLVDRAVNTVDSRNV